MAWVKNKDWFGDHITDADRLQAEVNAKHRIGGFCTVNTDASYYDKTGIGAYAFWIFGNDGKKQGAGAFKGKFEPAGGPTKCEILAIGNALAALENIGMKFDILIINTDSKDAARFFTNPHDTGDQATNYAKLIFKRLVKKRKAKFQFRYVAAHAGNMEGRNFVNEWCDLAARNARRAAEGKHPLTFDNKDKW